jgi:hypothetical protein
MERMVTEEFSGMKGDDWKLWGGVLIIIVILYAILVVRLHMQTPR